MTRRNIASSWPEERISEFRSMWVRGVLIATMADRFRVSEGTVRRLAKRLELSARRRRKAPNEPRTLHVTLDIDVYYAFQMYAHTQGYSAVNCARQMILEKLREGDGTD